MKKGIIEYDLMILTKMLNYKSEDRYQNFEDLQTELESRLNNKKPQIAYQFSSKENNIEKVFKKYQPKFIGKLGKYLTAATLAGALAIGIAFTTELPYTKEVRDTINHAIEFYTSLVNNKN